MPNLPKQPAPRNEQAIREAWGDERAAARRARAGGDTTAEWHHLERAHILSQPLAVATCDPPGGARPRPPPPRSP